MRTQHSMALHHRATVVERNGYRFIIEFSSGATIEVYPDEITFD